LILKLACSLQIPPLIIVSNHTYKYIKEILMTKKLLCFSIVGAIASQSVAFASTANERVDALSSQSIVAAQKNLDALRTDLMNLDDALANASKSIREREEKGIFANGAAVTGAAIGLGLSAFTLVALKSKTGAIGGVIVGALASAATLVSAGSGGIGSMIKPEVNVESLDEQLNLSQEEIKKAQDTASSNDEKILYRQLSRDLADIQKSVRNFDDRADTIKRGRIMSQIAQATGAALTVFSVTNYGSRLRVIGPLVGTAGNLGAVIMGLKASQAQDLLSEIDKTRLTIADFK
jgi:3-dehydroquinate dehydratase